MKILDGWTMVANSSKGYYNTENFGTRLQRGFLTDEDFSMLFYASDAVILPYTVS
jgi:hypothetical protein